MKQAVFCAAEAPSMPARHIPPRRCLQGRQRATQARARAIRLSGRPYLTIMDSLSPCCGLGYYRAGIVFTL